MRTTTRKPSHTTDTPRWPSDYGTPKYQQTIDPASVLHVAPELQADYWALAQDPATLTPKIRDLQRIPENSAVEISSWGVWHPHDTRWRGLQDPAINGGPPLSTENAAYRISGDVERDTGVTTEGLLGHIIAVKHAEQRVTQRASRAITEATWKQRYTCDCCGRVDPTTRLTSSNPPPDATLTALAEAGRLCQPCRWLVTEHDAQDRRDAVRAWITARTAIRT
jgi:hypothetical protein